jgi:hypothetical protein
VSQIRRGLFVLGIYGAWTPAIEIAYMFEAGPAPSPGATPPPGTPPPSGATPPPPGSPPGSLGGLDLARYCQSTGATVVLGRDGLWYCQRGRDRYERIDMQRACQWQYNNPAAMAQQVRPNDPHSWTCVLPPGGTPPPPPSPPPLPSQESFITIRPRHSGKCLDIEGGDQFGRDNGAKAHQWDCLNVNSQKWQLLSTGDGYYNLKAKHSGRCLDIEAQSRNNGAKTHQWDCHSGDSQKWQVIPVGEGYYTIRAKHSGKCLDVEGVSSNNGAKAHQWDCYGGDNQQWRLQQTPP